jgi:hypothetical protein
VRGQDSQANCGPYALMNALRAIGIMRTREELEVLCGTTMTDGTPPRKILRAVSKIEGCYPVKLREKRRDIALLRLRGALDQGRPVVLVWHDSEGNPGGHWVAAVGMLGDRYLIADAADNELVLSLTVDEVATYWTDEGVYEGVIL